MKIKMNNNGLSRPKVLVRGSILIIVVFVIALMTALVAGLMQLNTEQIQIMRNEYFAAQAAEIAHAGLADAFGRIRRDHSLPSNFSNSSFGGGSYSVQITGSLPDPNIISTGASQQGFISKIRADITVDASSYVIRIDKLRINE